MVSSYLICDVCGGFGPPAGFLSHDGLRLCYQCWHREQHGDGLSEAELRPSYTGPLPDSRDPSSSECGSALKKRDFQSRSSS